jgi:hypothetical protein
MDNRKCAEGGVVVRWLAGLFLIAHGLLHFAIWGPPKPKDVPFDAHHSPMFGDIRAAATILAVLAGAAFVVTGIAYLSGQDWWAPLALVASGVSIVLLLVTFTPWWIFGLLINAVIAVLAWRAVQR